MLVSTFLIFIASVLAGSAVSEMCSDDASAHGFCLRAMLCFAAYGAVFAAVKAVTASSIPNELIVTVALGPLIVALGKFFLYQRRKSDNGS